jgi:hypothetical protein
MILCAAQALPFFGKVLSSNAHQCTSFSTVHGANAYINTFYTVHSINVARVLMRNVVPKSMLANGAQTKELTQKKDFSGVTITTPLLNS